MSEAHNARANSENSVLRSKCSANLSNTPGSYCGCPGTTNVSPARLLAIPTSLLVLLHPKPMRTGFRKFFGLSFLNSQPAPVHLFVDLLKFFDAGMVGAMRSRVRNLSDLHESVAGPVRRISRAAYLPELATSSNVYVPSLAIIRVRTEAIFQVYRFSIFLFRWYQSRAYRRCNSVRHSGFPHCR